MENSELKLKIEPIEGKDSIYLDEINIENTLMNDLKARKNSKPTELKINLVKKGL